MLPVSNWNRTASVSCAFSRLPAPLPVKVSGTVAPNQVQFQMAALRWRLTEGIIVHVLGTGVAAGIAFFLGLLFAGSTNSAADPPTSCVVYPVPEKAE
jgi:hypothetical protein